MEKIQICAPNLKRDPPRVDGPMEDEVVYDRGVHVGELVPGVAIGGVLNLQPLVQLVEYLLHTVGHPFVQQDLEGTPLGLLGTGVEVAA